MCFPIHTFLHTFEIGMPAALLHKGEPLKQNFTLELIDADGYAKATSQSSTAPRTLDRIARSGGKAADSIDLRCCRVATPRRMTHS